LAFRLYDNMGRQGGIARFTGSVGDLTFYFDDDKGKVKWKSRLNQEKWLARREMWRQHDSSRLFGAAAVVASNLWKGMPAGIRRLADGSGYGRLVGQCASLMGGDGQLCDADLLKGLELNNLAVSPSVRFRLGEMGLSGGVRLEGLDQLNRELDLAMGDSAGSMPAEFLMAHGLSKRFGFGMNGMKLTAEEARVKTAFRGLGARDQGLGARNSVSGSVSEEEASGSIGVRPEASSSTGPKRPVQRRYRVWVNAVKVADTLWNEAQKKFYLDASKGVDGLGYVTEWEQNFPSSVDLRNPFEGEKVEFDGDYVVYCALEVSEKRGRHWVRLPYCCRFRVVDVVAVENGRLVMEDVGIDGEESNGGVVESGKLSVESELVDFAACDGLVLIEFKGHSVPRLDILSGFMRMGAAAVYAKALRGSGIRAGP
jgi:hypothetical protein